MTVDQLTGKEIKPDGPSSACAACCHKRVDTVHGHNVDGVRRTVDGVSLMLCIDVAACTRRYRGGRTAAQYAAALRNGTVPA